MGEGLMECGMGGRGRRGREVGRRRAGIESKEREGVGRETARD